MKPAGPGLPFFRREKSRGVAALELALAMVFLVPLLAAMLDFGYYFFVASNAEEAARAGVRQAALTLTTACLGGGYPAPDPRTANTIEKAATTTGANCNTTGGDAACYMNQPPLNLGTSSNITVKADCLTLATVPAGPSNPTWRVTVTVDFPLAYGFFKNMFFKTSTRNAAWTYYTATVTSTP